VVSQRRERPAQQHGGKAFDFRLSDGRTISVPASEPGAVPAAPTIGTTLVEAIAAQDQGELKACFAPGAELRALVPCGLRERRGADEAAALIAGWFADATELRLVESQTEEVSDRVHIAYRFDVVEDGQPYVVEHHLYCTVAAGVIEHADLLCSGFRPRS
jgi:hypothetical protein